VLEDVGKGELRELALEAARDDEGLETPGESGDHLHV
jgi:hypothetical protein